MSTTHVMMYLAVAVGYPISFGRQRASENIDGLEDIYGTHDVHTSAHHIPTAKVLKDGFIPLAARTYTFLHSAQSVSLTEEVPAGQPSSH